MHRFDEQFVLEEANRNMRIYEERAILYQILREQRRSRSFRQRLARTLVRLAERLEPNKPAAPCEGVS